MKGERHLGQNRLLGGLAYMMTAPIRWLFFSGVATSIDGNGGIMYLPRGGRTINITGYLVLEMIIPLFVGRECSPPRPNDLTGLTKEEKTVPW